MDNDNNDDMMAKFHDLIANALREGAPVDDRPRNPSLPRGTRLASVQAGAPPAGTTRAEWAAWREGEDKRMVAAAVEQIFATFDLHDLDLVRTKH
jgi:hypothetical protein